MDKYDKEINDLSDYFDHILDEINPEIKLDYDQRRAIVSDDDYALIIAGAGTGKTTTMVARVKYLVDIKKVDPRKILVLSFARKNVEELRDRINVDLNIPADVSTFHSLGYRYMKTVFGTNNRKCYVVDNNEKEKIFSDFIRKRIFTSKESMKDFMDTFDPKSVGATWLFGKVLKDNIEIFDNFDEYFVFYKNEKLKEIGDVKAFVESKEETGINADSPRTLRGEYVKSKGEAIIANFLFKNGIDYDYEKIYEEIMPDLSTYRPDFTLHLGGETIYVEYFGLSAEGVMHNKTYERIRKIKEQYHEKHHTRFIALDYDERQGYLNVLRERLEEMGFGFRPQSYENLTNYILDQNPIAELFKVKRLFIDIVDKIKSSPDRASFDSIVERYINGRGKIFDDAVFDENLARKQYNYVKKYIAYYSYIIQKSDPTMLGLDYADMIFFAKRYIEQLNRNHFNYDYVVIDEYQDISYDRYDLTMKTLARNHAKLMAIGDDWQSIYAFTGSKIEYTYNFQKLFPNAKLYRIERTYRTVQSLADIAGDFIMKNRLQIKKQLKSDRDLNMPILIAYFDGESKETAKYNEAEILKERIIETHKRYPNDSIAVLARLNSTLKLYNYEGLGFKDELNTKMSLEEIPGFMFETLTIHRSKGLTFDRVFLIGLDDKFPRNPDAGFWLEELFKSKPEQEPIEFAEERRVFYVALTRTKNQVTLLCNTDSNKRSKFLDEILPVIEERNEEIFS